MNLPLTARAVLFDLDGVLVDSHTVINRVWKTWAQRHRLPFQHVQELMPGRRAVETVRLAAPHLDATSEAAELNRVQETDLDGILPCTGAHELVKQLAGIPRAVVTSGNRSTATARLAAVRLPSPDILITADDVRYGKPNPEGYFMAASRLGVAPEQCLVVEDAEAGAQAGRAAGAQVVGVGEGLTAEQVDLLVLSLTDLLVERHKDGWFSLRRTTDREDSHR